MYAGVEEESGREVAVKIVHEDYEKYDAEEVDQEIRALTRVRYAYVRVCMGLQCISDQNVCTFAWVEEESGREFSRRLWKV